LQVYESLQAEGYSVDYERIPITDEKSPKERDFDSLVSAFPVYHFIIEDFLLDLLCGFDLYIVAWSFLDRQFCLQVQRLSQVEVGTKLVFNCQMGRGRTTTGMVIATLIHLRRVGALGLSRTLMTSLRTIIYCVHQF